MTNKCISNHPRDIIIAKFDHKNALRILLDDHITVAYLNIAVDASEGHRITLWRCPSRRRSCGCGRERSPITHVFLKIQERSTRYHMECLP